MPPKVICVGANYTDHVEEMERAGAPKVEGVTYPFSFLKPPSTALVGSGAEVTIPGFGEELDWEAELAIVIGRPELAAPTRSARSSATRSSTTSRCATSSPPSPTRSGSTR